MTAPSLPTPVAPLPSVPAPAGGAREVRLQDRLVDAIAAALLGGGVFLFFAGRAALTSIADGTYAAPTGESWVQRADFHAAQTQWGMWLIGAGIAVALVSAARHALHRRSAQR